MERIFSLGLRASEHAIVEKSRRLPVPGEVMVRKGDRVKAEDVVARAVLPGKVHLVNVAASLSVLPEEIGKALKVAAGDKVGQGDVIARAFELFGFVRKEAVSPVSGTVESVSEVTGNLMIRADPEPLEVRAYIDGEIVEADEANGVVVRTAAAVVQGIFGLGGEASGEIRMVVKDPDALLSASQIDERCRGKIVVGGALLTEVGFKKAVECGVAAIVVGGVNYSTLAEILGRQPDVAMTGGERIGTTLVVTEGFGPLRMAQQVFDLLSGNEGRRASACGTTQVRAGVIRPEVVIPAFGDRQLPSRVQSEPVIEVGSRVRAVRQPHFGKAGRVTALPPAPARLPTEGEARVAEVELDEGGRVEIARVNLEVVER